MSWNSGPSWAGLLMFVVAVPAGAVGLDDWIKNNESLKQKIRARLDKKKPVQTETISLSRGSTSFVDQSSGADLLSTAFSVVPVGRSTEGPAGAGSVSASFYALHASAVGQDPLRPSVYTRGAHLRKYFVTLGREGKQSGAPSDQSAQGTIVGFKWMPVNRREATSMAQDDELRDRIDKVLGDITTEMARSVQALTAFLFEKLGPRTGTTSVAVFVTTRLNTSQQIDASLQMLTPAERASFDSLLNAMLERQAEANVALPTLVQELQRRGQLAFDFQTTQRPGAKATDTYRAQLVYDVGVANRFFATLNAGYQYSDNKVIGDARGARVAGELRRDLITASVLSMRSPMSLAVSAEGVREKTDWAYRAQVRFVLPLGPGVDFPLSVGYGNRIDILPTQENDVFGKFGLTFNMAKLFEAVRSRL